MPSASHDELPDQEIVPGYSSRCADWGGVTVAFERAHAGQDVAGLLDGLPDGRCRAPHWGFLFSGRIVVDYGDHEETIVAGQAYYVAPGHRLSFQEDSDALEFTPTAALEETFAAARRKAAAADG
ncbi:MAG: cupin domain-containing protein [Gaiellaceae bacterium]